VLLSLIIGVNNIAELNQILYVSLTGTQDCWNFVQALNTELGQPTETFFSSHLIIFTIIFIVLLPNSHSRKTLLNQRN